MPTQLRLRATDFYDFLPPGGNLTGDIWSDLPTYGLLAADRSPGIVITPACDLYNHKAETVTYLIILPIRAYFTTAGFYPHLAAETNRIICTAPPGEFGEVWSRFPPDCLELERQEKALEALIARRRGKKGGEFCGRARAGVRLMRLAERPGATLAPTADLDELFGQKNALSLVQKAVKNSLSLDIHFLPPDGQPLGWSAVPVPSLVLFRYSISAPVELFDAAQDTQLHDWGAVVDGIAKAVPAAAAFRAARPLKRARLRATYAADLVTRYVAMFIRLGSPDLTPGAVSECLEQARS